MRVSRLLAISSAAGLLSGGLLGYPQFVDAGWSHEAALWFSLIGVLGPALIVIGLAVASRAVRQLLGVRRDPSAILGAPPQPSTPGRQSRAA